MPTMTRGHGASYLGARAMRQYAYEIGMVKVVRCARSSSRRSSAVSAPTMRVLARAARAAWYDESQDVSPVRGRDVTMFGQCKARPGKVVPSIGPAGTS